MNAATHATNPSRSRRFSPDVAVPRDRTEESAQRLTLLATRHWERALSGALAVPAAAALTTAAAALFAASVLERAFDLVDSTLGGLASGAGVGAGSHAAREVRSREAASSENVSASRAQASGQPGGARARSSSERGVSAGGRSGGAAPASPRTGTRPEGGGSASARSGATPASRARGATPTSPTSSSTTPTPASPLSSSTTPASAASSSTPARESEHGDAQTVKTADSWDVVLVEAGANPIALIRELRELTGRELRDLELLVSSAPEVVKGALARADAERLREHIEVAGGRVELRRA